jgi:hypothetical protein
MPRSAAAWWQRLVAAAPAQRPVRAQAQVEVLAQVEAAAQQRPSS